MGNMSHAAGRLAAEKTVDLLLKKTEKNPEKMIGRIMDFVKDYMHTEISENTFENVKNMLTDENTAINKYINRILDEVDPKVARTILLNLGFEAFMHGTKTIRKMRKIHHCNVPWLILMDPTTACNLHCTGCWAAEYGNKLNLSYDEMSDVIRQGKELGIYFYMFTGGEPLMRKKDLIRLCKEHSDCTFFAYTNGTLVDEAFCKEMKQAANLMLAISLEGSPEVNDLRRGEGVYGRVIHAMDLLRENGLVFGTSICYTSKNCESVTSREFVKLMVEKGCRYAMYFHYMPVGNDASMQLLPTPEQRIYVKDRIREMRRLKDGEGLFTMDFQNDGEFVGGCIAGGRNYFHINANGDAEPCVFIHYSGANIRTHSLIEILKQPLFMAYHDGQPFNENHFRPCPMLENPEKLMEMVHRTMARSTDLQSPETVEHLCAKCKAYAENWKPCADKLWQQKRKK